MKEESDLLALRPFARSPVTEVEDGEGVLLERIRRLEKINAALMDRVERSTDVHGNAYSLFQTAINLELQVRARTEELTNVLRRLEHSNEELRRAKDDADQANAYKTRFLAAAGHDLLQPLNAARLSLSTLADVQESEEGVRLAGQVDRALGTIEELLKTLLDISKLDAGVTRPDIQTVSLAAVLASLESDFAPIVRQKELDFRVRPTDLHALTDPLLLRRILQNLISNAVRYTPKGGILVSVRRVAAGARIQVFDTGVGIPVAEYQTIFDEFRRGSAKVADATTGLGLGLSIVRRMVQALGHQLSFRSIEGRGSSFSVTVPTAIAPPPQATAVTQRAALGTFGMADAHIAVVENDASVRDATAGLLTRWGCLVSAGADRAGLLSALEGRNAPNLILADYHLDDDRTGLEVIEAVRAKVGRPVPAVVVTANYSVALADSLRAAGCDVMQKPVKPAELRALISHMLG